MAKILPGNIHNVRIAAEKLKNGKLVAFPTETVYGLGSDAQNEESIARLYKVKNRPKNHPVIVHISTATKMELWTRSAPKYALDLAERYWPGPLTLILERSALALDCITGGQNNVALRVPNNFLAQLLLTEFEKLGGLGIVAPSANIFGSLSPTTADAVKAELGDYLGIEDLILDGGQCQIGIESTIIDCTGIQPQILRPGWITSDKVKIVSRFLNESTSTQTKVSGSLDSHYAPSAQIYFSDSPKPGEGFIANATFQTPLSVIRLAAPNSVEEFAQQMYAALRHGDNLGLEKIAIALPENVGLGVAINDRLIKAAFRPN
jgi:L-threonylcarbamoyladenylate synthase